MKIKINNNAYSYNITPDTCPICHHGIEPLILCGNLIKKNNFVDVLQIIYRCPKHDCQKAFIATFWPSNPPGMRHATATEKMFNLKSTSPYKEKEPVIPDEIQSISNSFKKVFSQAHSAEHQGLDQIAGTGYRKALEFLVKDFCISRNADKEKEIKKKFLGVCIDEFVDDINVKQCAKLATWLGNDETHYIRIWEDKDIKDLKILIELTMAWIRNSILTKQYMTDMNNK